MRPKRRTFVNGCMHRAVTRDKKVYDCSRALLRIRRKKKERIVFVGSREEGQKRVFLFWGVMFDVIVHGGWIHTFRTQRWYMHHVCYIIMYRLCVKCTVYMMMMIVFGMLILGFLTVVVEFLPS